jgi:hypothetical protein
MSDQEERFADLGRFIEQWIGVKGFKKGDVARGAGISGATLREILRGVPRDRPNSTWARLSMALELPDGALRNVVAGAWSVQQLADLAEAELAAGREGRMAAPADVSLLIQAFQMLSPERKRFHLDSVLRDAVEALLNEEVSIKEGTPRFKQLLATDLDRVSQALRRATAEMTQEIAAARASAGEFALAAEAERGVGEEPERPATGPSPEPNE